VDEAEVTLTVTVGWLVVIGLALFVLIETLVKRMTIAHLRSSIGGLYMKDTQELKVGDRVELINTEFPHTIFVSMGSIGTVIGVHRDKSYEVKFNEGFSQTCGPSQLKITERTLDTLQEGDVVVDCDGDERTVLGMCGRVYLMSGYDGPDYFNDGYTAEQLKEHDYKIKGAEEEVEELTIEEISKRLGKTVKIVQE